MDGLAKMAGSVFGEQTKTKNKNRGWCGHHALFWAKPKKNSQAKTQLEIELKKHDPPREESNGMANSLRLLVQRWQHCSSPAIRVYPESIPY